MAGELDLCDLQDLFKSKPFYDPVNSGPQLNTACVWPQMSFPGVAGILCTHPTAPHTQLWSPSGNHTGHKVLSAPESTLASAQV